LEKFKKSLADLVAVNELYESFGVSNLIIAVKMELDYPSNEIIDDLNNLVKTYPNESNAYNTRSNFFRKNCDYENALSDIYKALQLNTENGFAYSTLAEIKICQQELQEFYRNFELALKYGFDSNQIFTKEVLTIYRPFFKEEIFIKLLEKYNKIDTLEKIKKMDS